MTALAVFRPTCAVCFKLCLLKCVLLLCTYSANMTWLDLVKGQRPVYVPYLKSTGRFATTASQLVSIHRTLRSLAFFSSLFLFITPMLANTAVIYAWSKTFACKPGSEHTCLRKSSQITQGVFVWLFYDSCLMIVDLKPLRHAAIKSQLLQMKLTHKSRQSFFVLSNKFYLWNQVQRPEA